MVVWVPALAFMALRPRKQIGFLRVPNQLGVEHNARLLETIARDVAPAFGRSPASSNA